MHKDNGFTIVELLVVIVVIAILATIGVLSYDNIKISAENSRVVVAAKDYEKLFTLYKTKFGRYPIHESISTSTQACLTTNASLVETSDFSSGNCYRRGIPAGTTVSDYVTQELRKVSGGELPNSTTSQIMYDGYSRSLVVTLWASPNAASIAYSLIRSSDCPVGVKVPEGNYCKINLP